MSAYLITAKNVEALRVASLRDVVDNYASVGPLFDAVFGALGAAGIPPAGPTLAIYYDPGYLRHGNNLPHRPRRLATPRSPGQSRLLKAPGHQGSGPVCIAALAALDFSSLPGRQCDQHGGNPLPLRVA